MRTALVVAFMGLALQPGGPTRGAGGERESSAASASSIEVVQPRVASAGYCGRLTPGNLTAQTAVLEDEVQLVLESDYGTSPADF